MTCTEMPSLIKSVENKKEIALYNETPINRIKLFSLFRGQEEQACDEGP